VTGRHVAARSLTRAERFTGGRAKNHKERRAVLDGLEEEEREGKGEEGRWGAESRRHWEHLAFRGDRYLNDRV